MMEKTLPADPYRPSTRTGELGKARLRICLLTETYHPVVGGGETQARLLAEGLLGHGCHVSVVSRRVDRQQPRHEELYGVDVHRLPPTGSGRLSKWGMLPTALAALMRRRRRPDLFFVSGFRILGVPAMLAARRAGVPCVLKADSPGEMSGAFFTAGLARWGLKPSSLVLRPLLASRNRLLRSADAFVAISSLQREELLDRGVSSIRVHSIPNSVDTARFKPLPLAERAALRRRLGIPFEHQIITFTGRLVRYKGLPLLLRVWDELRREHPRAGLLLVGAGGLDIHNCEAELRQFAARHDMERSVHFAGDVDNVHEFLQASDIFAFPTEKEAFGISLIEAMACGLPAVATAVGGLKDIVDDGVNALVAPAGEKHRWSAALGSLIDDGELRRRLGAAGRRTVEQRYSSQEITKRYLDLFESLVAEGSGAAAGANAIS